MSDLLVWIEENFLFSIIIFTLIIIPMIEKFDSNSKIHYIGKNKGFGFTKSAVVFAICALVFIINLILKWNFYIPFYPPHNPNSLNLIKPFNGVCINGEIITLMLIFYCKFICKFKIKICKFKIKIRNQWKI